MVQVILGIFLPPYILLLEFKSKEELQLMPQTMEEHLDDMEEEASENDRVSISSFDDAEVSPTKNLIPVLINMYQSKCSCYSLPKDNRDALISDHFFNGIAMHFDFEIQYSFNFILNISITELTDTHVCLVTCFFLANTSASISWSYLKAV